MSSLVFSKLPVGPKWRRWSRLIQWTKHQFNKKEISIVVSGLGAISCTSDDISYDEKQMGSDRAMVSVKASDGVIWEFALTDIKAIGRE